MSFVRTATKKFADIPHKDTCCCGDCPTEAGKLERISMDKVIDQCVEGERVTILVSGRRRTIKRINCDFENRMDVYFTNGDRKLYRPEDEVLKVSGVTK